MSLGPKRHQTISFINIKAHMDILQDRIFVMLQGKLQYTNKFEIIYRTFLLQ